MQSTNAATKPDTDNVIVFPSHIKQPAADPLESASPSYLFALPELTTIMLAWICANALSAAGPVPQAMLDATPPQSPQTQSTSSSSTSLTTQVSSSASTRSHELVDQALATLGLLKGGDEKAIHTFGVPFVAWKEQRQLQQATGMMREYLTSPDAASQEDAAVIIFRNLHAHIIAIANLIPALASAESRAYSEKQQHHWQTIVGTLLAVLRSQNDQVYVASQMASALYQILAKQLRALDNKTDGTGFFETVNAEGTAAADLNTMLGYIVAVCTLQHADREAIREQVRQQRQSRRRITASRSERARVLDTADPGADMIGYVKRAFC